MNTKQENFKRQCQRNVIKALFIQSEGDACGKPDNMRAARDWRETFKLWGYVPCEK